jgi:AraC-like DNA-binding protein
MDFPIIDSPYLIIDFQYLFGGNPMSLLNRFKFLEDFTSRLVWVTKHDIPPDLEYPTVSFANTIIWIVLSGSKRIEVRGEIYEAQEGDIIVIPSQTPRAVLPSGGDSRFRYITVGCDFRVASMDFVELYKIPLKIKPEDPFQFARFVEKSLLLCWVAEVVLKKFGVLHQPEVQINLIDTDQTMDLLMIKQLFLTWFAHFMRTIRPCLPDNPISVDPRLQKVCAHIQRHLADRLEISELAHSVYLSESHLRLLFRKTFGYSPYEYLLRVRLHRSKELLAGTSHSLTQISEIAGFESLNKFSRTFKRKEGMTASDYRKMYKGSVHR